MLALAAALLAGCSAGGDSAARTSVAATASPARQASPTVVPAKTAGAPAVPPPTATGASGVAGYVSIGPTCPVERADSPCPDAPYAADLVARDESGVEVAHFTSGSDGKFSVTLPPGRYLIVPARASSRPPYAAETAVEVVADAYRYVEIQFDSGIR